MNFKVGESVWINSKKFTSETYGRFNISLSMLGQRSPVERVIDKYNHQCIVLYSYPNRSIDSRDLGYECTYEPFDLLSLPTYFNGIEELNNHTNGRYSAEFIMYKDDPSLMEGLYGKSLWDFLEENVPQRDFDDDPCDGCWGDCDDCDGESGNPDWQERQWNKANLTNYDDDSGVVGGINSNHACFADLMLDWVRIHDKHNEHPDRLLLKLRHDQMLQELKAHEVVKFWDAMKSAKCLPHYLKLPTFRDLEAKSTYYDIRLSKISKEKLFWYLCVLRNPCEQPGLVAYTNHFIDKGIEPLTAYITSHACLKGFHGAHSAIGSVEDIRDPDFKYEDSLPFNLPKVSEVVKMAVQCRKLLTRKTLPYIHEAEYLNSDWQLSREIERTKIRWKAPEVTITTLPKFSPRTRKLED